MSNRTERDVLQQLAAGELTTDEAESLLDVLLAGPTSFNGTFNGGGRIEIEGGPGGEVTATDDGEPLRRMEFGPDSAIALTETFHGDGAVVVPADGNLTLRLSCAEVEVRGVTGTLQAVINAGPVRVGGLFTRGSSRVFVNCGVLDVVLMAGSDVRVVNHTHASVEVDDHRLRGLGPNEWQMGGGRALLELSGNLGVVELSVGG